MQTPLLNTRMSSKHRRKDSQKCPAFWESMVNKYEGRNSELEEKECELQARLDLLEKTAPQQMLYNMWRFMQSEQKNDFPSNSPRRIRSKESLSRSKESCKSRIREPYKSRSREPYKSISRERSGKDSSRERSRSPIQSTSPDNFNRTKLKNPSNSENKMVLRQYIRTLEQEKGELTHQKYCMENMIKDLELRILEIKDAQAQQNSPPNTQNNEEDAVSIGSMEFELMKTVQELRERGIEMSRRIEIMEKREAAYLETLKQADEICSDMEIGYKQHCYLAEQNEAEMRDRLQRLKKREDAERRCCYGDSIRKGRDKKIVKQDHSEGQKYWSMFDPICSMLNRWH